MMRDFAGRVERNEPDARHIATAGVQVALTHLDEFGNIVAFAA